MDLTCRWLVILVSRVWPIWIKRLTLMFRFFQAKTPMFHANVDVCIPVCHDSRESCYQQTSPPLAPRQPIVAQQNDPPLPPPLHQTCCCLHCVWRQGAVREDAGTCYVPLQSTWGVRMLTFSLLFGHRFWLRSTNASITVCNLRSAVCLHRKCLPLWELAVHLRPPNLRVTQLKP